MLPRRKELRSFLATAICFANFFAPVTGSLAATSGQDDRAAERNEYVQALADAKNKFGNDAPETLNCKMKFALYLKNVGLYAESETMARAALEGFERTLGPDSLEAAKAQDYLGRALRHQFCLVQAEICQRKALAIRQKKLPANDPQISDALQDLAKVYSLEGREKDAKAAYLQALDIANASGDAERKDFVLANLAGTLIQLGEYKQAKDYLTPLLNTFARQGEESRNLYADILALLGHACIAESQYDQARGYLQRALDIFRQVYPPTHQNIGVTQHRLGICDENLGRYDQAAKEFAEAVKIQPWHDANAFSRGAQKARFAFISRYEPILVRSKADTGKNSVFPDDSDKRQTIGFALEVPTLKMLEIDANAPAASMFAILHKNRVEKLGTNSPLATEAALQMAIVFRTLGGYSAKLADLYNPGIEAFATKLVEPAASVDFDFNRNVEILGGRQAALGFAHDELLCAAYLSGASADVSLAEKQLQLAEKCLLAEKNEGKDDIETNLLNLAKAWGLFGRYQETRRILTSVLHTATAKKDEKLQYAALVQLSELDLSLGDVEPASAEASQAESMGVHIYGATAHELIPCYRVLSQSRMASGNYLDAVTAAAGGKECKDLPSNDNIYFLNVIGYGLLCLDSYQSAKEQFEKVLSLCKDDTSNQSEDRSLFTAASAALAEVLINLKDNQGALRELDWALSSDRANPTAQGLMATARDYMGLARVEELEGDKALAARYALQAAEYTDKFLKSGFNQLSFAQQCIFVNVTRQTRNLLITTCGDVENLPQAYGYMMKWKGLLLETLRSQSAMSAATATKDGAARKVAHELINIRTKISEMANSSEGSAEQLYPLTEKKEALERELSRIASNKQVADLISAHDVEWFRSLLKPDEAFLDIFTFKSGADGSDHYALIALKNGTGGEPRLFDLGPRIAFDKTVAVWRLATTRDWSELRRGEKPQSNSEPESQTDAAEYRATTEQLWKTVIANPDLTAFLGSGVKKIWLCPEAAIARMPWNSLATICNTTAPAICEVDSPREFVQIAAAPRLVAAIPRKILLAAVTTFRDARASDLPSTRKEITDIRERADNSSIPYDLLLDDQATKANVCAKMTKASIVHLSTHGFARGSSAGLAADENSPNVRFGLLSAPVGLTRNPLSDSGIVWARLGSNPERELATNIMTAEEFVGIDLTQCNLVSLSACQSGLGHGLNGQGVIGLRSSILAAGAKSILMSLWSVDDKATAELMQRFYGYLWDSSNPVSEAEALHKAQDDVRSQPQWKEPVFWAGWVLGGDGFQSFKPQVSQVPHH